MLFKNDLQGVQMGVQITSIRISSIIPAQVADSPSATPIFLTSCYIPKKAYQPSHKLVKFFYSPIKSYNFLLIITIKRGYNSGYK